MSEALAHLTGDYVLQSSWMATEKLTDIRIAALHGATYAACFLPITRNWKALAVIGGTHAVIDRWRLAKYVAWGKNQIAPKRYRFAPSATGYRTDAPDWLAMWLLFITDNTMHMLINRWALKRWAR